MLRRIIAAGKTALAVAALALLTGATTPNTFVAPQTPKTKCIQFLQGTDSAGTYKTLLTGGSNGSKIVAVWATSFDPSLAHLVTIQVSSSTSAHCSPATSCFGGTAISVTQGAGSTGALTPTINLMSLGNWPGLPRDSDGIPYFYLTDSTFTVEATFATALTASDWINLCAVYGDF